jgi:hypothetical protein
MQASEIKTRFGYLCAGHGCYKRANWEVKVGRFLEIIPLCHFHKRECLPLLDHIYLGFEAWRVYARGRCPAKDYLWLAAMDLSLDSLHGKILAYSYFFRIPSPRSGRV